MGRSIQFVGRVRSVTADEKKVEIKVLVDQADISAHEDLIKVRGRQLIVSMEETQQELALDGDDYE